MDNDDYDDTESNEGDGMIVVGRVTTMTTKIVVEVTERNKLMK